MTLWAGPLQMELLPSSTTTPLRMPPWYCLSCSLHTQTQTHLPLLWAKSSADTELLMPIRLAVGLTLVHAWISTNANAIACRLWICLH